MKRVFQVKHAMKTNEKCIYLIKRREDTRIQNIHQKIELLEFKTNVKLGPTKIVYLDLRTIIKISKRKMKFSKEA